jgi:hypothetical protein
MPFSLSFGLFKLIMIIAGSSNGRTSPFEGGYRGSSPCPAAKKYKVWILFRIVARLI